MFRVIEFRLIAYWLGAADALRPHHPFIRRHPDGAEWIGAYNNGHNLGEFLAVMLGKEPY